MSRKYIDKLATKIIMFSFKSKFYLSFKCLVVKKNKRKLVIMRYLFLLLIFVCIAFCIKNKIKINFVSFLRKGFKPERGSFGVTCYCGKQGAGKTYACVEFLNNNKNMKIYSNLKSLNGINYIYFNGLKELLELRKEHDCIIMYDEIFTEITKHDKLSKDVLDFLCQMRKRQIIFITTAQEWGELPLTLRRYVRFQVQCSLRAFPFIGGLSIKKVYDADNLHWSQDENDWIAPIIGTLISHTQLKIANSYDTFEQIGYNSSSFCDNKSQKIEEESTIDNDFWSNESKETLEESESNLCLKINKD